MISLCTETRLYASILSTMENYFKQLTFWGWLKKGGRMFQGAALTVRTSWFSSLWNNYIFNPKYVQIVGKFCGAPMVQAAVFTNIFILIWSCWRSLNKGEIDSHLLHVTPYISVSRLLNKLLQGTLERGGLCTSLTNIVATSFKVKNPAARRYVWRQRVVSRMVLLTISTKLCLISMSAKSRWIERVAWSDKTVVK